MFDGELDPSIAELMGIDSNTKIDQTKPTFNQLFGNGKIEATATEETVSLQKGSFASPQKHFNSTPDEVFSSPNYYRTVLEEEGDEADRYHKALSSFAKAKDPQEKSLCRVKLISAYRNLITRIAAKIYTQLPKPKKFAFRYGLTTPALLQPDVRNMMATIIQEKETEEPIFYIDEWLTKVAAGVISPSATDETKQLQINKQSKNLGQITSIQASITANKDLIRIKTNNVLQVDQTLKEIISTLTTHDRNPSYPDLQNAYSISQKSFFSEITQLLNQLRSMDAELVIAYNDLGRQQEKLNVLKKEVGVETDENSIDNNVLEAEFDSTQQMTKMCVGRQGNHLPVLMSPYLHQDTTNLATRENIITILKEIEDIDPELFYRTYKRETYRIVPYILLLPNYGDVGICWEPFERYNRATSRGRIAIPMYPKNLKLAMLTALGDLRWQVAKEKAAHYWMEEGLTGGYYQYTQDEKLKGNIKEHFIKDYILWISKESTGTQKVEKEVRRVFWRHMPFSQSIKEMLKLRGTIYADLCKRDLNRQASDGY